MTIETSKEIVDAILSGDKDQFNSAFETAIATKVSDALEIKKVEVASNWLGAAETEVSDNVAPEASTEIATDTETQVEVTA